MKNRLWPFSLMCALFSISGFAQGLKNFDPVKNIGMGFHDGKVVVAVPEGAHLKAAFMGIKLGLNTPGKLDVGPLPPTVDKDELGDGIWHDNVAIPIKGSGLSGMVELLVRYQPCTEGEGGVCYPPTTQTLKVKASDIPGVPGPKAASEPLGNPAVPSVNAAITAPNSSSSSTVPKAESGESQGLFWTLLAVFLAGMAASLTPCVFPMIPITMAIIGAKGGGKLKGFILSLMLVLGMAVTYTALGVIAAKTGAAFGAAAQKPAFLVPVAILFVLLAISLFGAFELRLPAALQARLQGDGQRKGLGGAFVMGLVLGPISAPCVGPVIGAVLLKIAEKGDVSAGALQLFIFALGMGVLFVVVGTFSAALPKSGDWLTKFKHMMGLVVLAFAVWSLRFIVPEWANLAMWSAVALIGAAVLGAFEAAMGLVQNVFKALGLLSLALGVLLGIRAVEGFSHVQLLPQLGSAKSESTGPAWISQDLETALAKAKAEHKIVLVDIYADWCAQCHELDEKTWSDPAVQKWIAENVIPVRIDTDKVRPDLAEKLKIRSYPTVLVLDENGQEKKRSLGFQKPMAMLAWLNQ
ncbi:MAG: protein-disulfide reductase DsbD [Holophagaceae bacterium]|nr:protein-disulfide reductase DsbD [Holophagaceae bacterium]